MDQATPKRLPPWPQKKRVIVAVVATFGIMLVALILGSMVYFSGRWVGIFPSQSLVSLVKESLLKDPEFMRVAEREWFQHSCTNGSWQFRVWHSDEIYPQQEAGEEACLMFVQSGSSEVLQVSRTREEKSEAVEKAIQGLSEVVTDSFPHNLYEATQVRGYKNGKPYRAIVMEAGVYRYVFSYTGSSESFTSLIRSFQVL